MKRYCDNNKGFSLLELLVAAAILAIVVIPFLSAFLTSSSVSAKAKEKERATTAVTNVMESMKAEGLEAVLSKQDVTKGEDGTLLCTYVQTVDGKEYTVEALLDATSDVTDATDEATDYNQETMAEIYSMSATYDGFYQQSKTQDMDMAKELLSKSDESDVEQIYQKMQREMKVEISKVGITTTVYVQSNYDYVTTTKRVETSSPKQCIYSSSQTGVDLRNIYLYYQSMENESGQNSNIRETIMIENQSLLPVNVYLIQQNEDVRANDNGSMNVICLEEGRESQDYIKNGKLTSLTKIRANLEQNQMKIYYGTVRGSFSGTKVIDGTSYSAKEILNLTGLEGGVAENRVYQVTMRVYEGRGDSKGDESLITYTTTMQKE